MLNNICFVFDFDLTLSDLHSAGDPKMNIEYISKKQLEIVLKGFINIITRNKMNKIIILTRTPLDRITIYLKNNYQKLNCLINRIYGSDLHEFRCNNGEEYWAQWKVEKLNTIKQIFSEHKIIFFDDTILNISAAKKNGHVSIHIEYPNNIGTAINKAINEYA